MLSEIGSMLKLIVPTLLFCLPSSANAADSAMDFLVMDVCVDGANKVILGKSPTDPDCQRRDLSLSDTRLPYSMHRHQGVYLLRDKITHAVMKYVGKRTGAVKNNIPEKRIDSKGVAYLRVISPVDQGSEDDCGAYFDSIVCPAGNSDCKVCKDATKRTTQGVFSYNHEPSYNSAGTYVPKWVYFDKYAKNANILKAVQAGKKIGQPMDGYDIMAVSSKSAYIMGTMDGNGGKFWLGESCRANRKSMNRFTDSWILFPIPVPAKGTSGKMVTSNKGGTGSPLLAGSSVPTVCPGSKKDTALTTWARADVTYTGGLVLDTILSSHYSPSSSGATGVSGAGNAKQIERFFMTKEFGKSRWEAWKRDDYVYNDEGSDTIRDVKVNARIVMESGQCNAATPGSKRTSDGIVVIIDGRKWYMTACADYTAIKRSPAGEPSLPNGLPGLAEFFNGAK